MKNSLANMTDNFKTLGCRMSFKIHFLYHIAHFFSGNLCDVGEEEGKQIYWVMTVGHFTEDKKIHHVRAKTVQEICQKKGRENRKIFNAMKNIIFKF